MNNRSVIESEVSKPQEFLTIYSLTLVLALALMLLVQYRMESSNPIAPANSPAIADPSPSVADIDHVSSLQTVKKIFNILSY